MKVGLLGSAAGGAGGVLQSLLEGFVGLGHEVISFRPQLTTLWANPLMFPELTVAASIDTFVLKSPRWPSLVSERRDRVGILSKPDFSGLDLLIVRWPNGLLNFRDWPFEVPVLWGLPDQNAFTGVCHYSGSCFDFESGCQKCPALRPGFSFLSSVNLQKKISLYAKFDSLGFVAPSDWIATLAQRSLISDFPIRKIRNPLASEFLNQNSARELSKPRKIRVGFAATNVLDPLKGFEEIAPFLEKIQNSGRAEVLTAGRITNMDKRRYSFFRHMGPLSRSEIINFYDALDLVLVPSVQEAAGMVALEAMSRGAVPVIRSSGGLVESVGPEVGFVFNNLAELEDIFNGVSHESLDQLRIKGMRLARERDPLETARQYLEFASSLKT